MTDSEDNVMVMDGCAIFDAGGPDLFITEAGPLPRSLRIHVGRVDDNGVLRDEPHIWVTWQRKHHYQRDHEVARPGPVMLTPSVWRDLNTAVEERLARHGC